MVWKYHSPVFVRWWSGQRWARRPNPWPRSWRCPRTPVCPGAPLSAPSASDRSATARAPCGSRRTRKRAIIVPPGAPRRTWRSTTAGSTTIFGHWGSHIQGSTRLSPLPRTKPFPEGARHPDRRAMHVQRRARSHAGPRATERRATRPIAEWAPRRSMPRDRSAPARPLPSAHTDPRTATFSSLLFWPRHATASSTFDDNDNVPYLVHGSRVSSPTPLYASQLRKPQTYFRYLFSDVTLMEWIYDKANNRLLIDLIFGERGSPLYFFIIYADCHTYKSVITDISTSQTRAD